MDTMTQELQTEESTFKQDLYFTIAQRIANGEAGEFVYCLHDGKIYFYDDGVWKAIFPIEFLNIISNKLLNKRGYKLITKFDINNRKKIIENFKVIKYLPLEKFNRLPLINLENYMFDPIGINILAHKKEQYSTMRINYKYEENAKCELWLKTLNEIFEEDVNKKSLFQEFVGYCLIPDVKQKKAMLLLGESDSGKSTLLFIIRDLIGDINCSSVPLKFLAHPQYTPLLINKLVNIDADVDKNAQEYEAEFKKITTGEKVSCNQKHIPTFEFIPTCKIIMAANEFPRITDHSSAFYTRLILLPCNRVFTEKEKNRNLTDELRQELPGILNWAIEGLKRLRTRGMFEQHEFMREAVKELEDENNPVNSFFQENIEIDVDGKSYIEKTDLFNRYKQWCIENKQYNLSNIRFSICVHKKFHKETPKDARLNNNGARIWRNLRYVKFNSQQEDIGWQDSTS